MRLIFGAGARSGSIIVSAVLLNALVAVSFVRVSPVVALAMALVPAIALLGPLLTTARSRELLLAAALALTFVVPALDRSLPLGGANIRTQDIIVLLALGGWVLTVLVDRRDAVVPRTPVLGVPFVLLAVALTVAVLRGHYAYGSSLIGQPLRLVLYAGIVVTLVGMTAERLLRLVTIVYYTGVTVTMIAAVYYISTGTSQTDQTGLSTGGTRPLAISTSIFCAGALFLALLRLRVARTVGTRLLHSTMAAMGLTGVILGFGRAVFAAVFLACLGLLLASKPLRRSLVAILPLAAPFLVLFALLLPRVAPDLITSFEERVTAAPTRDANVQWRLKANEAVLEQVREQPLYGVGFGRRTEFYIDVETDNGLLVPFREEITQDPHNGYLFLLAGGGLVTLAAFLLVLATYGVDALRRLTRSETESERILVLWSALSLFPMLLNAASGTTFESPSNLANLWVLLLVPAVVLLRPVTSANAERGRKAPLESRPGAR